MIEELLRAAGRGHAQVERTSIPACADELLREAAARYGSVRTQIPFAFGAMITPRKDSIYSNAGEPHVVVELVEYQIPNFSVSHPGSNQYGHIVDVRVLRFAGDTITPFWVESWQFEPWVPANPATADQ